MNKIGNNISFKGKYAIYGDKEQTSKAVSHVIANKKDDVDFFPITMGTNRLVIVATDKDVVTLKNKKNESDFISNVKQALLPKNMLKRISNLFNYIFSSSKDVPVISNQELEKIGTRFNKFDYTTGEFVDKSSSTVTYADGTYKKYSSLGNIFEQKFEDGTIRKNNSKGYIIEYPNGTYKQYASGGNLKEEKFEDGSIETYRYSSGKQLLQSKIIPANNPNEKPIVRNYLYSSNVLTFITESTGKIAKVDKYGNETWLDIDAKKIGEGFKEEFKDPAILVRYYTDGSQDCFKCGFLHSTRLENSTKIFYHNNGNVSQIRKPDGIVENYYEQGNLKSVCDSKGLVKEFNIDGTISFERLNDDSRKYYRYLNLEVFTFVAKDGLITETDGGVISENKELVTFTTKNGSSFIFDCIGKPAKPQKTQIVKQSVKKTRKTDNERPPLPIFVQNSLKRGGVVDYQNKTVSFLRNNDIIDIYNYEGVLRRRRFPEGEEKEFDKFGNVVAETNPFGTKIQHNIGNSNARKIVTTPDGIQTVYAWGDKLAAKIYPDGTEIRFNNWGQPIEKILPNKVRGTYHYEPVTNRLLFISYTDNSIVSDEGDVDRKNQTISFTMKDGSKHIYSSNGKLVAVQLKSGVTNILDEEQRLKEKVYKNGTRALYNKKGILTSKIYTNGIIEEYNERGIITKITDAAGDSYEYFYGKLIRAPKNILIRSQKQRNLYNSARKSLISTIAWKLAPETKAGLSEHAQGDAYLASIIEKKNYNQKLDQALKFSRPVDYSEPMEISNKENIKYLSYLKQSWADTGVEEFSQGMSAAYEIFRQYIESGVDAIEDLEAREAVKEWIEENPDKNNVLMYSKK